MLIGFFFQAGPIESVRLPKENGKNRPFGFITFKYQASVPYALSIFSGTKLFNREIRMNNRKANNTNDNNNQSRGQAPLEPKPILPNAPLPHQFQLQNPFGNAAVRGADNALPGSSTMNPLSLMNPMGLMNPMNNNMMPPPTVPQLQFPQNNLDFQTLLQFSAQMLSSDAVLGLNNMNNDNNDGRKHQSKIMHRHENRSHNQNPNYGRDRDRRNDRRSNRSRSRSRDRNDWVRNQGRNNKPDRRDRNHRGNDNNRRRTR